MVGGSAWAPKGGPLQGRHGVEQGLVGEGMNEWMIISKNYVPRTFFFPLVSMTLLFAAVMAAAISRQFYDFGKEINAHLFKGYIKRKDDECIRLYHD